VHGGLDPTRPVHFRYGDSRDGAATEAPLPQHWAAAHGHDAVAALLSGEVKKLRPDITKGEPGQHYRGHLSYFDTRQNKLFGFIEPDPQQGLGKSAFVHLEKLRDHSSRDEGQGYPRPGQRLIFGVSYDRQGRARATWVADEDRSYVRLPLRDERVASAHWRRWREADRDSSDEGWDIGLDDDEYY